MTLTANKLYQICNKIYEEIEFDSTDINDITIRKEDVVCELLTNKKLITFDHDPIVITCSQNGRLELHVIVRGVSRFIDTSVLDEMDVNIEVLRELKDEFNIPDNLFGSQLNINKDNDDFFYDPMKPCLLKKHGVTDFKEEINDSKDSITHDNHEDDDRISLLVREFSKDEEGEIVDGGNELPTRLTESERDSGVCVDEFSYNIDHAIEDKIVPCKTVFYMCPMCLKIHKKLIPDYNYFGACAAHFLFNCDDCKMDLVSIDYKMIPIIYDLNKKGYFTKFCCTGHIEKGNKCSYYNRGYLLLEKEFDFTTIIESVQNCQQLSLINVYVDDAEPVLRWEFDNRLFMILKDPEAAIIKERDLFLKMLLEFVKGLPNLLEKL